MDSHNYVRTFRKQWALSEIELGHLLGGLTRQGVSAYECGTALPSLQVALALEVVFGAPPRDLFPHLYEKIENEVLGQARSLSEAVEDHDDEASARKRLLLKEIVDRSNQVPA
jgi:transcriptional regulator with XRE-family HTH domain